MQMSSLAQSAKQNLFLRGFIAALVVATAFATLMSYRHLVPKGIPRLLSQEHEVRRELARAERINLRTGVICEEGIVRSEAGQQSCTGAICSETFDQVVGAAPAVFSFPTQLGMADLNRFTVLNL